jgi:hypothetical protein
MQQELSTTSILSLFETTKEERKSFVNDLIERLKEGNTNPLTVHLQLKCAEDIIKQVTGNDEYKSILLDESEKNGKSFEFHNAKFERKEVGVKYDYSQTNDPVITDLLKQQNELDAKVKERQKFLQTVSLSVLNILTEDGEAVTVYPPSKQSTTSIAVTLK